MRTIPHLTPQAWSTDKQTAFETLLSAWLRDDDLRRSRTATFEERHQALLELEEARRNLRTLRRSGQTLAA